MLLAHVVDGTPRRGWVGGMLTFHENLGLQSAVDAYRSYIVSVRDKRIPVKAYVDMSWMQSDREKNSMQSVPVPEKTWLDS